MKNLYYMKYGQRPLVLTEEGIEFFWFHKSSELEVQMYDKRHQNRVN